jgi:hypothetical protein
MKIRLSLTVLLVATFLLGACGTQPTPTTSPPTAVPPTAIPPTETFIPSPTSLPPTETPIPTPTNTPLPEGVIFRDDFNGSLQPGWTWENEDPTRWAFTQGGWLQIIANDGSLLSGGEQTNLLWRDLPEGNFEIIVHLNADPIYNFQQAAIFLYEDPEHHIGLNHGYCAPCVPGGKGVYMDYNIGDSWGSYKQGLAESDLYLKLSYEPNTITAYYAVQPDQWIRLGRFGNIFQFKRVGLGAANIDVEGHNEALVALYDYFEIRKLP